MVWQLSVAKMWQMRHCGLRAPFWLNMHLSGFCVFYCRYSLSMIVRAEGIEGDSLIGFVSGLKNSWMRYIEHGFPDFCAFKVGSVFEVRALKLFAFEVEQ